MDELTENLLARDRREDFRYFCAASTRWKDNDIYGHVNNVVFYSYFDSAANRYLIEKGGLDIARSTIIGVVVESLCRYRKPVAYPDALDVGVRVNRLGTRSVQYGIGVFRAGDEQAAAIGYFTHVFVERASMQPTPVPPSLREALNVIHYEQAVAR